MNVDSPTSPAPESDINSPSLSPNAPPAQETDEQKLARADKVKEQGNTAFKGKRFEDAIELYSKAIGTNYLFIHTYDDR